MEYFIERINSGTNQNTKPSRHKLLVCNLYKITDKLLFAKH